jgi:hypothetical protein
MAITTSTKGNEVFTDLPLTFSADQVIWDRKALCFYVMVTPFITYPSGQIKTFSQIRQIIQDTPAYPAILAEDGVTVVTAAVAANPAYTNMIASLGIDAVGTAMDNYVAGLPNPISPLN